jgi:hypothetical protein
MAQRRILVITSDIPHHNLTSVCPGENGIIGDWQILYNPPRGTECDFWIVFTTARPNDWMQCAPENTLYLAGEPPSKKVHPKDFYAQFNHVYSCNAEDPHPRVEVGAPCLNWHVGLDAKTHTYHFGNKHLAALQAPQKINKISVVCSNLTTTQGQRDRLAFLDILKSELGDQIVHFGRGFTPIPDKLDAILPYAYHLVLENSQTPHYWTEKLSDAYLGYAFPFYLGAQNIDQYFPNYSYVCVDTDNPLDAAQKIRSALKNNLHKKRQTEIEKARQQVLTKYNIFSLSHKLVNKHYKPDNCARPTQIKSHKAFRPFPKNYIYRLKEFLCKFRR